MAPQILLHGPETQRLHVCSSSPTRVSLAFPHCPLPQLLNLQLSLSHPFPFSRSCSDYSFLRQKKHPLAVIHEQRPYQGPQRGKAWNQRPTVFIAHFPPCGFYLFHTWSSSIMESHWRITLFCSRHVLSCRIAAHPVVLAFAVFVFPVNWMAHLSNKLNPGFFPLSIHLWNCSDNLF